MTESAEYLTKGYYENFLRRRLKNTSVIVNSIDISSCGESNGFLSILKHIKLDYSVNSVETSKICLVVKSECKDEFMMSKMGEKGYNVTHRELNFFSLISSRIEKIAKEKLDCKLIPTAFDVDEKHRVIIFEDLKHLGFETVGTLLDDNKTRLTLQKLAKFHATSVVLNQKYPNIFKDFDIGMFSRKIDPFHDAFESLFEVACDEIATWKGFEKYAEKMKKRQSFLIENALQCFDIYPNDFCVLNHGDLWKNNIMFKKDSDGNYFDAILVSFTFL